MESYEIINFNSLGLDKSPLISLQEGYEIPFKIKRVYYIFNTAKGIKRGFHAHKNLKQVVVAVKGSCLFILDDGKKKSEIKLDDPKKGLLIEGIIWREMKDFSNDCVLLVLASDYYIESDYIRNYSQFKELINNEK